MKHGNIAQEQENGLKSFLGWFVGLIVPPAQEVFVLPWLL
jgi:hypothetical protein